MRNKIITAGSGLFLAFGSVGGFEQGTMNLGQTVVLGIIGCMLMFVGIGGEKAVSYTHLTLPTKLEV